MHAATGNAASSPGLFIDPADRLALTAAPSFALMAWISTLDTPGMAICSTASAFLPVNDMALMYAFMSFFHLSPWLKLLSARRRSINLPNIRNKGD